MTRFHRQCHPPSIPTPAMHSTFVAMAADRRTLGEIAVELDITHSTASRWARIYDIAILSRDEARKTAMARRA